MTAEDRVRAVVEFGFTERQARFLAMVMLHSGVCLQRQYTAFAGIVHGQKTRKLFEKLVKCGYATAYPCRHNRGRVYRVHYKPLYRAIGETDSRHRRPMSAPRVVENLMLLDGLLANPSILWLAAEDEIQVYLSLLSGFSSDEAARLQSESARAAIRRARPRMPIGIDPTDQWVFLYVITRNEVDDLHRGLQQHAQLLSVLPAWTLRVVFPRHLACLRKRYEDDIRHELANPQPSLVNQLRWYFKQRRAHTLDRVPIANLETYDEARFAFRAPRYQVLYQRWLIEGDAAFDAVSSTAIADAIKRGAGRIEYYVLPFSYRHLSPLVASTRSAAMGAEEGEERPTPPRPPLGGGIASLAMSVDLGLQTGA